MRSLLVILAATLGLISACAATNKPVVDEDFSDLANAKTDAFSYRLRLHGELASGETRTILYTKTPRFRGFEISAQENDALDIWVRSTRGDALAWLLDGTFHVIAKNDDAEDGSLDSHITATLPASRDGVYYIVFRDFNVESHRFSVTYTNASTSHGPPGKISSTTFQNAWLAFIADDGDLQAQAPVAALPETAQELRTNYLSRFPAVDFMVFQFPLTDTLGGFAVLACDEEIGWVDVFDEHGALGAHGFSGDGCHTRDTWNWEPSDHDPSLSLAPVEQRLRDAFSAIILAPGFSYQTNTTYTVSASELPASTDTRLTRMTDAAHEYAGRVFTWKFAEGSNDAYAILSYLADREFLVVDLFDANGTWQAHAWSVLTHAQPDWLNWTADDNDPSMCACTATSDMAVCTWIDGSELSSGSIFCE